MLGWFCRHCRWLYENLNAAVLEAFPFLREEFVVRSSSANDPAITKDFRILTRAVAVQALGGEAVMMDLCDEQLHT
jgi:hypothetical protein